MNPWNGANASILPGSGEAMGGYTVFSALPPRPLSKTTFDPSIWPFPSSFRHTPPVVMMPPPRFSPTLGPVVPFDQAQDFLEQFPRHRDFGHLEDGVAGVVHDLGPDLDELLPQAGQRRPVAARPAPSSMSCCVFGISNATANASPSTSASPRPNTDESWSE